MSNLITTIIGGVIIAALVSWLGIGKDKSSRVLPKGFRVRKTGKWIIIISVIMIIWGLMLIGSDPGQSSGFNLHSSKASMGFFMAIFGGLLFIIGRIIEWFQKL